MNEEKSVDEKLNELWNLQRELNGQMEELENLFAAVVYGMHVQIVCSKYTGYQAGRSSKKPRTGIVLKPGEYTTREWDGELLIFPDRWDRMPLRLNQVRIFKPSERISHE